jgi:hypothetical protein
MKFSRKIIILLCLFGIVAGAVFLLNWFFAQPNEGQIVESDGSRIISSGTIRNEGLGDDSKFRDQVDTSCFSFQYPKQYSPKLEQKEGECVVRSGLFDPKGMLTVSWVKLRSDQKFTENTGLLLRIKNPDQYSPISLQEKRFAQIFAFNSEGETTIFADTDGGILTVSLHDFVGKGENRLVIAKQILQSVNIKM